ncbi:MAG: FAD-dependent monooxygenase [Candidatus Hodarchaeales archaeon]
MIIGAGPAGSGAAHACAKAGLNTVFVDRKKEVGLPIACSGAIGSYLIPFLPFHVPSEFLECQIAGLEFISEEISYTRIGGPWQSYAIDRASFDKWLAKRAQKAGAVLLLHTELENLDFINRGSAKRAIFKEGGGHENIEFKVLIGADGANSRVLDLLGEREPEARLGKALVYEYEGVELESPKMDQIFFGDFAPGGYAHLFPLSGSRANVGLGSIIGGVDLKKCFEDFISIPSISAQLKGARILKEKSGFVAFDRMSKRPQYRNVLLAGEAGSQNIKPLVEGFLPSIICGDIAGKTAARHILKGEPLENYQNNLNKKLGLIFKESNKLAGVLEEISDIKDKSSYLLLFGLTSQLLSIKEAKTLKDREYLEIKKIIVKRANSKSRLVFSKVSERAAIYYLNLLRRINSKIYKL